MVVTCLCGETLVAPDRYIGLRGRCPHCNRVRHIPKLGVATRQRDALQLVGAKGFDAAPGFRLPSLHRLSVAGRGPGVS